MIIKIFLSTDFNDFASQGCNSSFTLFIFPIPDTYEVGIAFQPDDKIEGTEVLTVQLRLSSASQTAVNNAGNIFIRDTSTIRVIDTTGKYTYYLIVRHIIIWIWI